MPTISCEFVFDRAPAIYYSGEQVFGNVALTTTKDLEVEVLQINCKGGANVSWYASARQTPSIEHNDGAAENQKLQYQGHEVYVNETRPLHKQAIIYAGRHVYKFSFNLPINCPATSARHRFGEIFYNVSLLLKRRTKFDKNFVQRFVVKKPLDLNLDGNKYMPEAVSRHYLKNIDTEVKFCTPHTGYVPGQYIKFRLDVATTAKEILRDLCFKVRLCQKYTFRSQQPISEAKEVIWKLAHDKLRCRDYKQEALNSFESSLHLPLLTPITSEQQPSAIISITYYLEALVFTKHKLLLTKLCIPITVGSEALKNSCESSHELEHCCYDNFKVADIHKISNTSFSMDIKKKALQDTLAPAAGFVKNLNCGRSITQNNLRSNKNAYLSHYSEF